jgi:hypothetical protein
MCSSRKHIASQWDASPGACDGGHFGDLLASLQGADLSGFIPVVSLALKHRLSSLRHRMCNFS